MRGNNRNPIERCRKRLPQFTTMNVIDGQAGLVIYSSLIFYSLTINNILNIIVLLILAGVTIATLTGENGILNRASAAKIETALGAVKEALRLEQIEKKIDDEEVNPETLLAKGKVQRTVQQGEDGNYYMYYALKENAYEGMQGLGKGNLASLEDVFLIDDDLNVKYIASNGKEYGDNIKNKILEDETEIRFSSKAFSEYVSKISGVTEEEMKFKWMKEQTSLTIADTTVNNLQDLVFFPNLTTLQLGDWNNNIPPITSMNGIENCTKLTNLKIISGPDKNYNVLSNLKNLKIFYRYSGTDYNNIIDELSKCHNLQEITILSQGIEDMSRISELGNLKVLNLANNQISKIKGLENMTNLTDLNLGNNRINKIEGLENLLNLKILDLNNNFIEDITPLSINTALTKLSLKGNAKIEGNRSNYTNEKLEALDKIGQILDKDGSILIDVDKLGLFTNYKVLDLSNENLETLEIVEGLTQLKRLTLSNNKLTLEDSKSQEILKNMINLETLVLNNNNITNIRVFNSLKNLKTLSLLGNNNINLKEIEDIISNLDYLTVSTQSLKTIVNCDINKITKLVLSGSNLTELPDLSSFTSLTRLVLNSNPIINIEVISNIKSLQTLNLYNCNLHGRMIDFSKLTNLTNLDLSGNTLWSEDLENLKALKNNTNLTINLSNNSIIDTTALLELNPNTKIDLRNNINLSQDSKDKLKARFGSNVTF